MVSARLILCISACGRCPPVRVSTGTSLRLFRTCCGEVTEVGSHWPYGERVRTAETHGRCGAHNTGRGGPAMGRTRYRDTAPRSLSQNVPAPPAERKVGRLCQRVRARNLGTCGSIPSRFGLEHHQVSQAACAAASALWALRRSSIWISRRCGTTQKLCQPALERGPCTIALVDSAWSWAFLRLLFRQIVCLRLPQRNRAFAHVLHCRVGRHPLYTNELLPDFVDSLPDPSPGRGEEELFSGAVFRAFPPVSLHLEGVRVGGVAQRSHVPQVPQEFHALRQGDVLVQTRERAVQLCRNCSPSLSTARPHPPCANCFMRPFLRDPSLVALPKRRARWAWERPAPNEGSASMSRVQSIPATLDSGVRFRALVTAVSQRAYRVLDKAGSCGPENAVPATPDSVCASCHEHRLQVHQSQRRESGHRGLPGPSAMRVFKHTKQLTVIHRGETQNPFLRSKFRTRQHLPPETHHRCHNRLLSFTDVASKGFVIHSAGSHLSTTWGVQTSHRIYQGQSLHLRAWSQGPNNGGTFSHGKCFARS